MWKYPPLSSFPLFTLCMNLVTDKWSGSAITLFFLVSPWLDPNSIVTLDLQPDQDLCSAHLNLVKMVIIMTDTAPQVTKKDTSLLSSPWVKFIPNIPNVEKREQTFHWNECIDNYWAFHILPEILLQITQPSNTDPRNYCINFRKFLRHPVIKIIEANKQNERCTYRENREKVCYVLRLGRQ